MQKTKYIRREKTEWCALRWANAPDRRKRRVLLIGDSIAYGYHRFVADNLAGKYNTDLLSTSKSLDDQGLLRELDYMFSEHIYSQVHFNNGLHGMHQSVAAYARNLTRFLRLLRRRAGRAGLIWASSTPVVCRNANAHLDPKINQVVLRRNQAAAVIMARAGIPINDLYQAAAGRAELRAADQHHFNPDGYAFLGGKVAEAIKNNQTRRKGKCA